MMHTLLPSSLFKCPIGLHLFNRPHAGSLCWSLVRAQTQCAPEQKRFTPIVAAPIWHHIRCYDRTRQPCQWRICHDRGGAHRTVRKKTANFSDDLLLFTDSLFQFFQIIHPARSDLQNIEK